MASVQGDLSRCIHVLNQLRHIVCSKIDAVSELHVSVSLNDNRDNVRRPALPISVRRRQRELAASRISPKSDKVYSYIGWEQIKRKLQVLNTNVYIFTHREGSVIKGSCSYVGRCFHEEAGPKITEKRYWQFGQGAGGAEVDPKGVRIEAP